MINGRIYQLLYLRRSYRMVAGLAFRDAGMQGQHTELVDAVFLLPGIFFAVFHQGIIVQRLNINTDIKALLQFLIGLEKLVDSLFGIFQ